MVAKQQTNIITRSITKLFTRSGGLFVVACQPYAFSNPRAEGKLDAHRSALFLVAEIPLVQTGRMRERVVPGCRDTARAKQAQRGRQGNRTTRARRFGGNQRSARGIPVNKGVIKRAEKKEEKV
ncbi:hypothetical protein NDU88_005530 [Pleurodeles waltl]|uniref:Uncharacterized protein n=1 Tax=Pleurodeles waltl TaxID=8319 RepID=A0AAV7UJ37_PLEWA|nr:hypothetical protein NDU88_005530 [Pleurodeles waltl]